MKSAAVLDLGSAIPPLKVFQFDPAPAIQRLVLKRAVEEDNDIVTTIDDRIDRSLITKPAYTKPFYNIYYNLRSIGQFVFLVLGFTPTFPFDDLEYYSN